MTFKYTRPVLVTGPSQLGLQRLLLLQLAAAAAGAAETRRHLRLLFRAAEAAAARLVLNAFILLLTWALRNPTRLRQQEPQALRRAARAAKAGHLRSAETYLPQCSMVTAVVAGLAGLHLLRPLAAAELGLPV